MVSGRIILGILAIAAIVVIGGCMEKPSASTEETQPTPTPELEQTPAPSPTATPTVTEVMTEEEINSLMQTIEEIEAIESELNIPEIDLNIDFE